MPMFHCQRTCQDIAITQDDFDYFIVDDARFKNEIFYTKACFPGQVIDIHVYRLAFKSDLTEEQLNHPSERDLDDYDDFKYFISSSSGLEHLERNIECKLRGKLF